LRIDSPGSTKNKSGIRYRKTSSQNSTLAKQLSRLYKKFHDPAFLPLDPLSIVHNFDGSGSLEIAGLVAAVYSYGRVESINVHISKIFDRIGPDLNDFIFNSSYQRKQDLLKDLKYRFNPGHDCAALLECLKRILQRHGSLEGLFAMHLNKRDKNIGPALTHFSRVFKDTQKQLPNSSPETFSYLFPEPAQGSTCKRLLMYLRWMVRPCDGIDFGVWKTVSPSQLVMPVDTHVASVSKKLGLTKRNTIDWKMAEEITKNLKNICADDPVKYDFSICRAGMTEFRGIMK